MAESKQIQDYYQIIKPKDLIGGFQKKSLNAKNSVIYEKAMDLLVNSDRTGASTFAEMIDEVGQFAGDADSGGAETVHNVIQIYADVAPPSGAEYGKPDNGWVKISAVTGEPSTPGTQIGVVISNSPFVSLNLRHMNHVTTFLTAIPSVELSRAVPFIDVNFQFKSDADGSGALTKGDGKHRVPSLIKFLEGAIQADGASATIAKTYDKEEKDSKSKVVEIDMGIFTAPQTLVNPDLSFDPNADNNSIAAAVGDKFRPLASLESINIDVVASPSYTVAYKSIKMQLILHDRTRLAEIANLIRPAVYTNTSMVIRYGWSHPDDPNTNPYAELISQMRLEERYCIKNASYSFDDVGQVKIELFLYPLGENQLWLSRISESAAYQNIQAKIENVRDRVFTLIQDLGIPTEADTRAYMIMNSLDSSTSADPVDKDLAQKINSFVSSVKNSAPGAKQGLAKELGELLQGTVKDKNKQVRSLKEELKGTVESAMAGKFTALERNPDPFLPDPTLDAETVPYAKDLRESRKPLPNSDKKKKYSHASLAKIFTLYVLQPLRQTGIFDEVQVIFYSFNDYCGNASGTNIGQFPVEISIFKKVMDDQIKKKNNVDMSVGSFGKLLNDAFIADPSALAYGMKSVYVSKNPGIDPPTVRPGSKLENEQDKLLSKGSGGSWKNPTVEFYLECLTKRTKKTSDRNLNTKTGNGSILRIHVYDKQSTPWDGFMKLKGSLSRINSSVASLDQAKKGKTQAKGGIVQLQEAIKELKDDISLGGASIEVKDGVVETKGFNTAKVKRLISSFVPTLTYGSNNTGILKANLQSIQEPRLASVNIIRQNGTTATSPNGAGNAGLPLRVIPGQIQMSLIGCPLLSINQHFFIDFGTNTDLDNFYALTGLSHTISAGKFETSAKFIWADAYGSYETVAAKFSQLGELIKKASTESK